MTQSDPVKRGRASRAKGARGERELADILKKKYGIESAHRGYVFNGQSDVIGLPGIHVEVKRVERLNVAEAMEQAKKESWKRKDGMPTVFHRKNNCEWLVTMRLEDWMKLYGK